MDLDIEDDNASSGRSHSDVKQNLLEIANSRPGTNVAKAIVTYHECPSPSALVMLLEEVSKNIDFSTDLRLSLSYYMDEFLRQASCVSESRRSVIAAAGNVLQYCGKIYGDRVELMFQVVEQQIAALIVSDTKPDDKSNNNGINVPKKPEELRRRRTKKLVQRESDPFLFKMETKKLKKMSDEKRFSRTAFEANKKRNRTIEHMYLDHTPANLWKHAPIVDPGNPYEQDEKKHYKVFTYHPEPRYNTLLPDIPFERLNLIKEYLHSNYVNISECSYENMTSKEYLDELIALENQMLASRYDQNTVVKRIPDGREEIQTKRFRLTDQHDGQADDIHVDSESEVFQSHSSAYLTVEDSQTCLTMEQNVSQLEASALSDTFELNDSSCVDSTRFHQPADEQNLQLLPNGHLSNKESMHIDSGIVLDNTSEILQTAFDDEGVVIPDNLDVGRLSLLSPKVMVQDILPGVPNKHKLSVLIDEEMMSLSCIQTFEEILTVPREVCFELDRNVFHLPEKKLRKDCIFKLTKEYDLFKQARIPTKRAADRKPSTAPRAWSAVSPVQSMLSPDKFGDLPLDQIEFDMDFNFRGFRRPTHDSGIDYEELRADSTNLLCDDNSLLDMDSEKLKDLDYTETEMNPYNIQEARQLNRTEVDLIINEIPLNTTELSSKSFDELDPSVETTKTPDDGSFAAMPQEIDMNNSATQLDMDQDVTAMDLDIEDLEGAMTGWESDEGDLNISKTYDSIDEETDAKIVEWHRRLAPALEAAHARQNFSIQDLNDEVIEKCVESSGRVSLADIMENKDPTRICCYLLSTLLLANQGNVEIQLDKHDKKKPIEQHELRMKLLTTERRKLNPEDEIGSINHCNLTKTPQAAIICKASTAKAVRRKAPEPSSDDEMEPNKVKSARLIKPVPKTIARPEDADSGISSLPASLPSSLLTDP